jgi:AraC-like DNA-binding protein
VAHPLLKQRGGPTGCPTAPATQIRIYALAIGWNTFASRSRRPQLAQRIDLTSSESVRLLSIFPAVAQSRPGAYQVLPLRYKTHGGSTAPVFWPPDLLRVRSISRLFTLFNSSRECPGSIIRSNGSYAERLVTKLGSEARGFEARLSSIADILAQASIAIDQDTALARSLTAEARAILAEPFAETTRVISGAQDGELVAWQARRVAGHVEANLAGTITVTQLALVARLSRTHFSRAFRRSFGTTPYDFILQRRVAMAKRLMAQSNLPLAEIASACGFCDQAHLSRIFKRCEGTSPLRWRRSFARDPSESIPAPARFTVSAMAA